MCDVLLKGCFVQRYFDLMLKDTLDVMFDVSFKDMLDSMLDVLFKHMLDVMFGCCIIC